MDTKILRLVAGAIITDNKKMSKASKHQMLEFIKSEATDAQIKGLLLDGKVHRLDKQAEKVIGIRFENSKLSEALANKDGLVKSIIGKLKKK